MGENGVRLFDESTRIKRNFARRGGRSSALMIDDGEVSFLEAKICGENGRRGG
jgi:hypothetical protein